jgi:hypothetical protein
MTVVLFNAVLDDLDNIPAGSVLRGQWTMQAGAATAAGELQDDYTTIHEDNIGATDTLLITELESGDIVTFTNDQGQVVLTLTGNATINTGVITLTGTTVASGSPALATPDTVDVYVLQV